MKACLGEKYYIINVNNLGFLKLNTRFNKTLLGLGSPRVA